MSSTTSPQSSHPESPTQLQPRINSVQIPRLTPRRRQAPLTNPYPAPPTPTLPPPTGASALYIHPTRRILSAHDLVLFTASPSYALLLSWIFTLADCVADVPISSTTAQTLSPALLAVLEILDSAEDVVRRCPPVGQAGSRFGNKGFRDFLEALALPVVEWHRKLGICDLDAVAEVSAYFLQSFGNQSRIDYGSGHELNFMVWLLCLYQLGLIARSELSLVVLRVFPRYLSLVRLLQSTYYLEPAGSHGVWGLDDYQFLPFLFGASQLLHHPYIRPLSIHQSLVLEEYGQDYLYLGQVAFTNSVKNVEGLRWHSPMLDDISAAKSWAKVDGGMRRMFVAEVLNKLPVMQHFLFGSLIPAAEGMSSEKDVRAGESAGEIVMQDGMPHVHQSSSWGDCCGIKVPGSIGAAQEMQRAAGQQLRRIPFD
ncbi:MAG: Serine/threonine-protein phosphatase 2A activator 2 [Trizodia sp. TS-e1964]|nr:MAG: Serine/threonine-protein phosphatase 2A activator 2 [Trizodia sp. TS-e1964]